MYWREFGEIVERFHSKGGLAYGFSVDQEEEIVLARRMGYYNYRAGYSREIVFGWIASVKGINIYLVHSLVGVERQLVQWIVGAG